MKLAKFIVVNVIAVTVLSSAGCTNKALYQTIQQNRIQDCQRQPPELVDSCLKDVNKDSYDEYERKRKGLEQSKKSVK